MFSPFHSLFSLKAARECSTYRSSSYDRSGGNADFERLLPGQSVTILEAEGPGTITHIWFALGSLDPDYLRQLVVRAWWDGEGSPSLECPLGDFFGVGHGISSKYDSAVMNMVRGTGERGGATGVNCWLPMPFGESARITVTNDGELPCQALYYQVDWLRVAEADVADRGRFHAQWRRNPRCRPRTDRDAYETRGVHGRWAINLDGADNFVAADLRGLGRLLGVNLSIDNLDDSHHDRYVCCFNEGDEWIVIDGEPYPPRLHGTGTEDYFSDAWGMTGDARLWSGTSLWEDAQRKAGKRPKGTCYRWHLPDPIYFRESLQLSFEHGHANHQANDLAATVYWYQEEPHRPFPLAPVAERLPVRDIGAPDVEAERRAVSAAAWAVNAWYDIFLDGTREELAAVQQRGADIGPVCGICDSFLRGQATVGAVLEAADTLRHQLGGG